MIKFIIPTLCLILLLSCCTHKIDHGHNGYLIGFYNVENLFDTNHDVGKNDLEFIPDGEKQWTHQKYEQKLHNLAFVINQINKSNLPHGLSVMGLSEVENQKVLNDLINTPPLNKLNLATIHYESPDRRGIDVALLYNTDLFKVILSKVYPYNDPSYPNFKTRDILLVDGILANEEIHIIVNHWPSRYNKSSKFREFAAQIDKHIGDSLYFEDSEAKIIIMGDLNDNPTNKSVRKILNAKRYPNEVNTKGYFNVMWELYAEGVGTLKYHHKWNLFDQIIISHGLLTNKPSLLKFWKAEIFNKKFLLHNNEYPYRTFLGNIFINGYSDHLPTFITLVKDTINFKIAKIRNEKK